MVEIPNTEFTARVRVLYGCTECTETWEELYARQSEGGTQNGRAVAVAFLSRIQKYWNDFHKPADAPVVAAWASMVDCYHPFITPDVASQAVDAVIAAGDRRAHVGVFLRAAQTILEGGT